MRQITLLLILCGFSAVFAQNADSVDLVAQSADSVGSSAQKVGCVAPRYRLQGIRVVADRPGEAIGSVEQKSFPADRAVTEMRVSDTLADISGLSLTTGGKGTSNLSIRGFDKDQVKVLLDGRPIGGGYFGSVDLHLLPVSELEAVQVIKGPVSALYGSDAMGGVINVLTRRPNNKSWLRTGLQTRRNSASRAWLSSSRDMGHWDYWAYFARAATDGMMLSAKFEPTSGENGEVRNNDDREQYDAQLRLRHDLGDLHSVEMHGGWTWMDGKGIPPGIYESEHRRFTNWLRWQLAANGTFQLQPALSLDTSIYWDAYDDTYEEYSDDSHTNATLHSVLKNGRLGCTAATDWSLSPRLRLQGGYRWEYADYNRRDDGGYLTWTGYWQQHHNLFAQTQWRLAPLHLTAGLGGYLFTQENRNAWVWHVEPSLGMRVEDERGRAAGLAWSHSGKFPSLHELFSRSKGNPDLSPEVADKFELALALPFVCDRLSGKVEQTAFFNDIRDLIETVGGTYTNIEQVRSWGGETTLRLRLVWEHHYSFSLLRYTPGSDIPLLESAPHSFAARETIGLPWRLTLIWRSRWTDARDSGDDIDHLHRLPSHWLHDVHLHRDFTRWRVSLGVENLLDENYQEEWGYPGPGIDFLLSVETELF
ncbi:MAG: TonB-dependent receptor [Candidatus Cloacimonetes bacterium]|nr:TonB-dependent receptor [Candidatus Cloacimonadota bacterium]